MKWFFVACFFSPLVWGRTQFQACPSSDNAVTSPAPVNITELKNKVYVLKDENGKIVFEKDEKLDTDLILTFDTSKIKTKMEQFYTLLWVLGQKIRQQKISKISFTKQTVQDVLLSSKVFTDPAVPGYIQTISFDVSDSDRPKYNVQFTKANIEVPLNQGDGFYLYRNGKCQHAEKLIFDQSFSFEMKKNLGNLMVTNFEGVDLFGDFGNRGFVDVDIQYVSLRSVEFLGGTVNGRVTAYVSREEFKKNDHNSLLEWVTKIVPDRSVQPIDW